MTSAEFNRLGYYKQIEAVLRGTFLAGRLTDRHYVKLYNLHSFYVEVFYDDRHHLITHFWAFRNTQSVTPYLNSLKIAV